MPAGADPALPFRVGARERRSKSVRLEMKTVTKVLVVSALVLAASRSVRGDLANSQNSLRAKRGPVGLAPPFGIPPEQPRERTPASSVHNLVPSRRTAYG